MWETCSGCSTTTAQCSHSLLHSSATSFLLFFCLFFFSHHNLFFFWMKDRTEWNTCRSNSRNRDEWMSGNACVHAGATQTQGLGENNLTEGRLLPSFQHPLVINLFQSTTSINNINYNYTVILLYKLFRLRSTTKKKTKDNFIFFMISLYFLCFCHSLFS